MKLSNILIVSIICVLAYAFGHYMGGLGTTKATDTTVVKDTDTTKTTTTTEAPTGVKTTTVTEHTVTSTERSKKTQVTKEGAKKSYNVSALAAIDYNVPFKPNYGVSVTYNTLGPITTTIWGLNNGTIGIGLGLDF